MTKPHISCKHDEYLVLIQARFKYPPHWVPLTMMYESMARIDPSTGQPRGYMSLKPSNLALSLYYTLDRRSSHVQNAAVMLQTLQGEIEVFSAVVAEIIWFSCLANCEFIRDGCFINFKLLVSPDKAML